MTSSVQFNALPLLAVKPALDGAWDKIGNALEQYFSENGQNQEALQEAIGELHRTYGALRMLTLDGVLVFCRELENLLQEFAKGSLPPSSMHREIIQRALLILTHYLNALANGAPNAALRLFDPYQELLQARGIETAFEVDLFFPELNIDPPPAVLNAPMPADAQTRIRAVRSQYQQALLRWLRQDQAAEALQTMRSAVEAAMTCVPQDRHRAFWWAAAGLLDCLIYDGLPPELTAKKLLGRVDLQMKSLVEGTPVDGRTVLTEMLYLVASSHTVSDRVDEIKRHYALDAYLPEEPPLPPGETAQTLEQMRTCLNEAEEAWEKCLQDATACKQFADLAEQLYGLSERLDRHTLQLLCKQIHTAAPRAAEPDYLQHHAMTMAMALMLLDSGIAHYTYLGDSFHEQVRILGQHLLGTAPGLEAQDAAQLMRLHCQMAQREIFPLLAGAMADNLQRVEQELNAFFGSPEKREELPQLVRLLNQIQGSLHMLSLDAAEQVTRNAKASVAHYAEGASADAGEMRTVATAISALGAYIHDLAYGQEPDSAVLEQMIEEAKVPPPAPAPAPQQPVAATAVAVQAPAAEDNEMLEVFLEEAQEVLNILRTNLDLSQLHPDSSEPLVTIRRGFHTLKGSGRMVGLNDFGEVAWAVERAMNKWLQESKPATPGLLQFIADAEALFHAWVDALRSHSRTVLDPAPLVAAAQDIEKGREVVPAAMPEGHAIEPPILAKEPLAAAEFPMELPLEAVAPAVPIAPAPDAAPAPALVEFALPDLDAVLTQAAATPEPEAPSAVLPGGESLAFEATVEPRAEETPAHPEFTVPDLDILVPPRGAPVAEHEESAPEARALEPLALAPAEESHAPEAPSPQADFTLPDLEDVLAPPISAPVAAAEPFEVPPLDLLAVAAPEAETATPVAVDAGVVEPLQPPVPAPIGETERAAATPPPSPAPVNEEREDDSVKIGNITLSASLFNIATEESANNLTKMQNYFAELRASTPPVIHYDFMRAAHTLAGINRTMGFGAVADLARALELWLEARIGKAFTLSGEQLALVDQAISMLDGMFLDICNYQSPLPQADLIARLQADQELLVGEYAAATPEPATAPAQPSALLDHAEHVPAEVPKSIWGADAIREQLPASASLQAVTTPPVSGRLAIPEPVPAAAPEAPPVPAAAPSGQAAHEAPGRIRQYIEERVVQDELDEQLLPIFLEESQDLQPQVGSCLRAWRENPASPKPAADLQRVLHTLKGSARMAGVMRLGELVHHMEDRVVAAAKGNRDDALWEELESYNDRIGQALDRLRGGATESEAKEAPTPNEAAPVAAEPAGPAEPHQAEIPGERIAATLRVRSDTVDRLVNEAGEISVARSRIETELRAFKSGLADMAESVGRLRKQLREIEIQAESQMEARIALAQDVAEKFDPLEFDRFTRFQELTRFMNESVHDVQTVQQTLLKNLDEAASAMSAQAYLNRDLQQSLMSIRMVPFSSVSSRLYRIVRQTAKELDKRAILDIHGGEVELDRSILERMTAPFEHLLRNAIAHGLESQEQRNRAGKQPIGQIRVSLTQESNEVVFDVSDDGAGINLDRLRQKAAEAGLVQPGASISDEDATLLIFSPGITTATEVTAISGRGVGMDVVRSEIVALGGHIGVQSTRGQGTRFTIRLPLTLAVTQILMTRAAEAHYAIPSAMVEQVLHTKPDALKTAYQSGFVHWHGQSYPLRYLPRLLGDEQHQAESRLHNPVLLLRSGEQRMALHVDELFGNQETVVKNIGPQLARQPGIAGATVLGSGHVVLILNPIALTQRITVTSKVEEPVAPAQPVEPAAETAPHTIPLIMVVDDSLTVRKVTSRMLTRAGYEVVTAKDGVDALEQLTQITPAVMLLDVEMPRMDGFELTKQIRRDPRLHTLPILMITSRTAEKHRDYALELGVNAYFGKPFQEEELLLQIASFVQQPA